MEKELIEKKKQEFIEIKQMQEELKSSMLELEELKINPYVQKFIKLSSLDTDSNKKFIEKSEEELLEDVIYSIRKVDKTNEIYFCLGTYMYSLVCDIEHGSNDILVKRDDPRANYRVYVNIENEFDCLNLSIKESDEFEKKHKVIFPRSLYSSQKEYYEIQKSFFRAVIYENQDEAIRKVLSRNLKSLNNI